MFFLLQTRNIFEYLNNIWEKRELKSYLCKLPRVAKEETLNFTDYVLYEIVSSFLHEFFSLYTRFWNSVGFFSLKNTVNFLQACCVIFCVTLFGKYSRPTNDWSRKDNLWKYFVVKDYIGFSKSKVISTTVLVGYFIPKKFLQLKFIDLNGLSKNTLETASIGEYLLIKIILHPYFSRSSWILMRWKSSYFSSSFLHGM